MADIHRYVDGNAGINGIGTEASPWKRLWNIPWTSGTNNVADDIAAGNAVYIHLKRGVTWGYAANPPGGEYINVNTNGTANAPITINGGNPSVFGGSAIFGSGDNAIIDNWRPITTWSKVYFNYNTGTKAPTAGQTLYAQTSGAVLVVVAWSNAGGWTGAGTGRIYYTITSGNVVSGEDIRTAALGGGDLICATTTDETTSLTTYGARESNLTPVQLLKNTKTAAGILQLGSGGDTLTSGQWYYGSNIIYYYPASGVPDDANNKMYGFTLYNNITTNGKSYINIYAVTSKGAGARSLYVAPSSTYCTVKKCEVCESAAGIYVSASGGAAANYITIGGAYGDGNIVHDTFNGGAIYSINSNNVTISYNTVYNCGNENYNGGDRSGIVCGGEPSGGDSCIIEYNEIYNCGPTSDTAFYAQAIQFYKAPNGICRCNYVHDNYFAGINVSINSDNTVVAHNIVINNSRNLSIPIANALADIELKDSSGIVCVHNTFYGNQNVDTGNDSACLSLLGGGTYNDWIIKNNIFSKPANNVMTYHDSGNWDGSDIDNNCYWGDDGYFNYAGADHSFADWVSDISGDNNSFLSSPLFINASGLYNIATDFKIPYNSPCFGTGAGVGYNPDYAGIYGPPSIGAYTLPAGSSLSLGVGVGGGRMISPRRRRR